MHPQVFAAAGLKSPIAASIITAGVNLLFTIGAASVMDRCVLSLRIRSCMHKAMLCVACKLSHVPRIVWSGC